MNSDPRMITLLILAGIGAAALAWLFTLVPPTIVLGAIGLIAVVFFVTCMIRL